MGVICEHESFNMIGNTNWQYDPVFCGIGVDIALFQKVGVVWDLRLGARSGGDGAHVADARFVL